MHASGECIAVSPESFGRLSGNQNRLSSMPKRGSVTKRAGVRAKERHSNRGFHAGKGHELKTICPKCGRIPSAGASEKTFSAADFDCPSCWAILHGATRKLGSNPTGLLMEQTLREGFDSEEALRYASDIDLVQMLSQTDFADYHVEHLLGRGGMAWVFLATHQGLRRPCALKILCPEQQASDARAIDEFLDEARAAAAIVHPHVVTVHNVGVWQSRPFVELEYVAGQPLSTIVSQRRMPEEVALEVMAQAVAGLAAAHDQGFVHRDFKPSNVLIGDDGTAKLSDFGLAHPIDSSAVRLAGTPSYMAPELFEGAAPSTQGDVYAVGVSLLECLTGEFFFRLPRWTEIAKLHRDFEWDSIASRLEGIAPQAQQIIRRCLAREISERFVDGAELHQALRNCQRMLRPLDRLLEQAMRGVEVQTQSNADRGQLVVSLAGGRRQTVYVDSGVCDHSGIPLIRIYSIGGLVEPSFIRRALEINSRLSHGAIGIEAIGGEDHFVVVNTYPRATCDPDELRHSVLVIAEKADELEQRLTGRDEF